MNTTTSPTETALGKINEPTPGKFEADESIVRNVHIARQIYEGLRTKHLKRINLYAEIEGLLQGNPPYDPAELKAAGLDHIANFNDMSARSLYERQALAYWNLLYTARYVTRFVLRIPNAPEVNKWEIIMAKNWDYAVNLYWPSFAVNVASLQSFIVKVGIGPVIFPDEDDPAWRVVEPSRFFIPDQTQADLDMMTMACVESEFTMQYLWGAYKENKGREGTGWNNKQLGKVLVAVSGLPNKDQGGPVDVFEMETKILNGDISFDKLYSDSIRIVSLFQKEYNGKVSHYMFHRSHGGEGITGKDDFLFKENDQYDEMRQAILVFTMNPGEYTIHANRGTGHKVFSLAQAKIQLDCSLVDLAKWSSTPIVKSSSLATKDIEQVRFCPGVPTNIGSYEYVNNQLGANLQGVIGTSQYLGSLAQFNLSYSGADPSQPDADKGSISPNQFRLNAIQEFSVQKNYVSHFYRNFDFVCQSMTGKMFYSKPSFKRYEMAKCWIERCIEDGVPPAIFDQKVEKRPNGMPKHIDVYATRVAGSGSQVAHLIGLQELGNIAGSFNAKNAAAYQDEYVIATMGPEYLPSFGADTTSVDEHSGGASLAAVENAIMQVGKAPVFSEDNEQRSHIIAHIALGTETIKAIQQQQMDVIQADSIFRVLVPHLKQHAGAVAGNPLALEFYQKVEPAIMQVVKYAELNAKNAARAVQAKVKAQRDAEQNQQTVMSDEELKNFQVQNEERRSDQKLAAQAKRQEDAGAAKETALERKTDADIARTKRITDADVEAKQKKAGTPALENTADAQAEADPAGYLDSINGETPAPYDIEGGGTPTV